MATYSSSAKGIRLYFSLNWLRDGSQEETLSKWLPVGVSHTIRGRSLRQKSRRGSYCEEKRNEARRGSLLANYFRNAATTKSKFIPTLSGREQRVREGATNKESNHRG